MCVSVMSVESSVRIDVVLPLPREFDNISISCRERSTQVQIPMCRSRQDKPIYMLDCVCVLASCWSGGGSLWSTVSE